MTWTVDERVKFRARLRRYQVVPREPGRKWVPLGFVDEDARGGDPWAVAGYELYSEWSAAKVARFEADTSFEDAVRLVDGWNAAADAWHRERAAVEARGVLRDVVRRGDGSGKRRPRGVFLRELACAEVWNPGERLPARIREGVERAVRPAVRVRRGVPREAGVEERPVGPKYPRGRRKGEPPLSTSPAWRWRRVLECRLPPDVAALGHEELARTLSAVEPAVLMEVLRDGRVNLWAPELGLAVLLARHGATFGRRAVR